MDAGVAFSQFQHLKNNGIKCPGTAIQYDAFNSLAHFMGKRDTVIDHLVRAGYQITPIPRDTTTIEAVEDFQSKTVHKFSGTPISRNRRKQEEDKELLSEYDVPEFRPRYVKFENNWIKIEDFKPNTYPNRLHRPSTQFKGTKLDSQNDQTSNDISHLSAASMTEGMVTDEPSKNVSRNHEMHSALTKPLIDIFYLWSIFAS
ncbi:hypothetical protein FGIG_09349 [Fasciola gigantica]|uniref:Uncharacterized protein n=1 Tax=Fasciola gigantica TaxID=46835 RepID=A0A504Z1B8_FASGI|nr:hypothetical protein FGIG_09349 [Fasciola gigantica]